MSDRTRSKRSTMSRRGAAAATMAGAISKGRGPIPIRLRRRRCRWRFLRQRRLFTPTLERTGAAVIGGYVYRGQSLNTFYQGRYFFADIVKGRIWSMALTLDSAGEATASDVREHTAGIGGGQFSAFGVDSSGELYVVYITGSIARVTSGGPCSTPAPAANWVCVSGGWVPPGHPLAGGGGDATTASAGADSDRLVARPPHLPPNWVCVNGGWVPPGHPLAAGGGTRHRHHRPRRLRPDRRLLVRLPPLHRIGCV